MTVTVGDDIFVRQQDGWGNVTVSPAKVVGVANVKDRPETEGLGNVDVVVFNTNGTTSALTTNQHTDEEALGWYDNYDDAANALVPLNAQEQEIANLKAELAQARANSPAPPTAQELEIAKLRAQLASEAATEPPAPPVFAQDPGLPAG